MMQFSPLFSGNFFLINKSWIGEFMTELSLIQRRDVPLSIVVFKPAMLPMDELGTGDALNLHICRIAFMVLAKNRVVVDGKGGCTP